MATMGGTLRALALCAPALIGLALGCGPDGEAPKPAPPAPAAAPAAPSAPAPAAPPDAARTAAQVFATRCTTCHGPEGRGDGPGAAQLVPSPRDFHDAAWQRSVTDAHLAKIVVEGGSAVGKSPMMPPNPDLASQPDVVSELVKRIRGFGST
jgi:mono/diheme cytochrome c family protein